MIQLEWDSFKSAIENQNGQVRCISLEKNYLCKYVEGNLSLVCFVPKETEQATELESNFLPGWNLPIKQEVETQLEKDDKTLGLASAFAEFSGGVCELEIKIPGTEPGIKRYVKEGYAFTDAYRFGTRITKVHVIDKDFMYAGIPGFYPATPTEAGIPGVDGLSWADVMPGGVDLGGYHDPEMPEINQGWRMWAEEGGQGGCDIDNLAGYGSLPAGTYLMIRIEVPSGTGPEPTKAAANIQWGIPK